MLKFSLGKVNLGRNFFMNKSKWNISTYNYQTLVVDTQYCRWKKKWQFSRCKLEENITF